MSDASVTYGIIQRWIVKGDNENNPFDKFIAYWIAFNACYSTVCREEYYEKDKIVKLLEKLPNFQSEFDNILTSSENEKVLERIKSLGAVINETRPGKEVTSHQVEFNYTSLVVGLLYTVRNNLFHGSKGLDNARDKEVIESCNPILEQLVKKLFPLVNF